IDIQQIIIPIKKSIPFHLRIRNIWHIPNQLNKLDADIVIEMAHFGPFRLSKKTTRVTVIHDLTPLIYPLWHDKISTYVHKLFLKRILRNANHIIANSQVTSNAIAEYLPSVEKKIRVAYPSLSIDDINSKSTKSADTYFLSVGTIEPRKNYSALIEAFNKVAQQDDKIKLVIIGFKGWKSKPIFDLITQSENKDRILIKGYVTEEELIQYYKNAMAFIFPTHYEGFGLPLLEAMMLGSLVICSDIEICREVCADSALYFSDTDTLARSMQKVVESPNDYLEYKSKSISRAKYFNDQKINLDYILS
ncbi:glycosyltransferase family 4 protein, partial [Saprospiraceae bacterium]|nr:glycosyltransferase family 4 protein [Saprospiraceae bacterium]